jgi:CHAD domain-containing protein
MSGAAMLRAVVAACLAQILPNAGEVAGGRGQAEHVHQLRVGLRRLRTALRELAGFGADIDPAWEPVLSTAFRALGEHRDRDHLVTDIQPVLAAAGGPSIDWNAGREAPADPREVAQAAELQGVLLDLIRFTLAPSPEPASQASRADREAIEDRLGKLRKQVIRDGKRFADLEPELRHRLRKRLKRLRYLAEFVAPLYPGKASAAFLDALEPAQDALGAYNDLAVALIAARAVAPHDPHAWFAVGWLAARQEAGIGACRKALARVGDAEPFWKAR